jgi:uncharacterized membrane protein YebE (DUF533 family)
MVNKLKLNDSSFAMWRGFVAMAYADHKLSKNEIDFLEKQLERIDLTPAQKEILENDIENGVKLNDVYGQITEQSHKTNLLNMAYVIFHRDSDFCHVEKNYYDELYRKLIQPLDSKELTEEAKNIAKNDLETWAKERNYREDKPGLMDDFKEFVSWLF